MPSIYDQRSSITRELANRADTLLRHPTADVGAGLREPYGDSRDAMSAFIACRGPAPGWFLRQVAVGCGADYVEACDLEAYTMAAMLNTFYHATQSVPATIRNLSLGIGIGYDASDMPFLRGQMLARRILNVSGANRFASEMEGEQGARVRRMLFHCDSAHGNAVFDATLGHQFAIAAEITCGQGWVRDGDFGLPGCDTPFGPLDVRPDTLANDYNCGALPEVAPGRHKVLAPCDIPQLSPLAGLLGEGTREIDEPTPRFAAHNVALAANVLSWMSCGSTVAAMPAPLFAGAWRHYLRDLLYALHDAINEVEEDDSAPQCACCGMVTISDLAETLYNTDHVCAWCLDNEYYRCEGCSEWVHEESHCDCGYGQDEDGYDDGNCGPLSIYNYSYKPAPEFRFVDPDTGELCVTGQEARVRAKNPADAIMFGVELETQIPHNASATEGGHALLESDAFLTGFMYAKSDCSVSGPELVSHPATLEAHRKYWQTFPFSELVAAGWRAWNGASAGLHVHISRRAFRTARRSGYTVASAAHLARFQLLFGSWREELTAFFGRNCAHYAVHDQAMRHKVCDIAKGNRTPNRSSAVNYLCENTIEVRMPRASLRADTVMAYIEFLHALVRYSEQKTSYHMRAEDADAFGAFHDWMMSETTYNYDNAIARINNRVCEGSN